MNNSRFGSDSYLASSDNTGATWGNENENKIVKDSNDNNSNRAKEHDDEVHDDALLLCIMFIK